MDRCHRLCVYYAVTTSMCVCWPDRTDPSIHSERTNPYIMVTNFDIQAIMVSRILFVELNFWLVFPNKPNSTANNSAVECSAVAYSFSSESANIARQ